MSPATATLKHDRAQRRRVAKTLLLIAAQWSRMGEDFDSSWEKVGPRIVALVKAAQLGAARDGSSFVAHALAEQGSHGSGVARVAPAGFVGAWPLTESTIGDLDDLLYGAVVKARTTPAESFSQRLESGRDWLGTVVKTQLQDASRQSTGATLATHYGAGYIRVVNTPCCQRCAVLAGRFYRYNAGFMRHPGCLCGEAPATEATWKDQGIHIGPDDVKDLTIAQRKAIDDGADFNQVINSHRANARSRNGMTTTEGTTRRGMPGSRLTPEAIYKLAASREETIAMLRKYAYIL